jgi:flagellar motor switch protein FliG
MDISVEFGNVVNTLDNDSVKRIIGKLDKKTLAKALKTLDPKISEKIFTNIPKNELDELKKLIKDLGPIRLEEVETAQKEIMSVIRK